MSPAVGPIVFPALGTTAVVLVAEQEASGAARAAVESEMAALDLACSRFREDSELSKLNASAGSEVVVSPLFLAAVEVALDAARATGGLVDPTIGSALRLMGYDRDFTQVDKMAGPLRVSVERVPGWRVVAVDRSRRTVRLPPGVELDLGATAKAWCADRAAQAAYSNTGCAVLVSLGGDVATAGPAPEGGWTVLVADDHGAPLDSPGQRIAIHSGGLATSGTSVRRWARGGRQLHHLIDPATGAPAGAVWRTVSVAARTCVEANTASTAAVIVGAGAPEWLAVRRLPARLVDVDGAVTTVAGWPAADEASGETPEDAPEPAPEAAPC